MATRCSICSHPRRGEIDRDLTMQGDSAPVVAARYAVGKESVRRHRRDHLRVSPRAVNEAQNAITVIGYAHDLYERASRLLGVAELALAEQNGSSRSVQAAAATLREVRQSIELLAKLVVVEPDAADESRNAQLDAQISEALAGIQLPALGPSPAIEDAIVLEQSE